MRASAAVENARVPVVSLICESFVRGAQAVANGVGFPNVPIAVIPGHVDAQTCDELKANIETVTLPQVIMGLTAQLPQPKKERPEPTSTSVVFQGSYEEVNRFFLTKGWSDSLPIIPPTREKIERFLAFTDRSPEEVIGVLLPDSRQATIWNTAVNGVMAGCRPEYMPLLVALTEAMADPHYGVEHSGNTPGAETLITLNGPIIKELDFNYEQGALRDGFQANTTIGRFWRLMLRNVAGFHLHQTDMATFGGTWRVVLAENEDIITRIGWQPLSVDQGFKAGENVLTVARHVSSGVITGVYGQKAEDILAYIADRFACYMGWEIWFTVLPRPAISGSQRPHLILTPVLAETIAKNGWSKKDVKQYLYDHARIPAWKVEKFNWGWTNFAPDHVSLCDYVKEGVLGSQFCESEDPNRMVPIVCSPDDFVITVSGDPWRTNAYLFISNGCLGYTTSKRIELPTNWYELLGTAKRGEKRQ
jgi:hypothetical protein